MVVAVPGHGNLDRRLRRQLGPGAEAAANAGLQEGIDIIVVAPNAEKLEGAIAIEAGGDLAEAASQFGPGAEAAGIGGRALRRGPDGAVGEEGEELNVAGAVVRGNDLFGLGDLAIGDVVDLGKSQGQAGVETEGGQRDGQRVILTAGGADAVGGGDGEAE